MSKKKSKFIERERPHLCPDVSCKMVRTSYNRKYFDEGGSFSCIGIMKKPHRFTDKKTEHINDINHCEYTPLKGMIRFFTCVGDLWSEIIAYLAVMDKLSPLRCDVCRKKAYRSVASLIDLGDGKRRCQQCYHKKIKL